MLDWAKWILVCGCPQVLPSTVTNDRKCCAQLVYAAGQPNFFSSHKTLGRSLVVRRSSSQEREPIMFPAEDRIGVNAKPLVQNRRIDLTEVILHSKVTIIEFRKIRSVA